MSHHPLRFFRLASLIAVVGSTFIFAFNHASAQNPQTATGGAPPSEPTVEQTQKNIQALKGLPESQLVPVMNYMAASLGVRCNFCHVNKDGTWDYPSDEKPEKKTAREMITMLTGINKNTFRGTPEVSCYTCHRGRTQVVHTLSMPLPTPEPRPSPAASPTGPQTPNPTAEQILDKYYQALGGTAAIDKLKSRVMKGILTANNGVEIGYELNQSGPDSVLAILTTPQAGVIERAYDGSVGWEKNSRGVRDLGREEIFYLRRYPDIYKDIKLKEQFTRLTFGGKPKIDGRDVYVLRGTTTGGKRETLYFDVETGLLVRRSTSTATLVGTIPEQVDFADYREVDGLKLPFTIRVSAIDPTFSVVRKFTEIKLNVTIDPKRFNKPA